jgi:hypothetical protein
MKVSIDGRRETVYSTGVRNRHLRFYFNLPGAATLPRELDADYVWIPRSLPAAWQLRKDPEWAPVYEGQKSVIFGRITPERSVVQAMRTAAVAPRFFPGP